MRDLYQKVTDQIVAQLETGTAPWIKSWQTGGFAIPRNATTNKPYRGINILLLWADNNMRYLTFKQAKEAGGHVRKGEHGRQIYFFTKLTVKDRNNPDKEKDIGMLKEYTVFHVDQCDGLSDDVRYGKNVVRVTNPDGRMPDADDFIKATGAKFYERGTVAHFIPSLDIVEVPPFKLFSGGDKFYGTSFHELVHWTGHKTRLDRNLKGRFGDDSYAVEELIAELGAAFVCAEFGINKTMTNSANYLAHWLKVLKADKRAIFTAASQAQKAVDHLRGVVLEEKIAA